MSDRKEMVLVFAGPNGSGKSTVTAMINKVGEYINADDIARTTGCDNLTAAQTAEKRIISVLAKNNGDKVYGELVYLSSVKGVYEKNESLIDKMDEPIMMRFMEILTRPE